jgi:hypothetical protein
VGKPKLLMDSRKHYRWLIPVNPAIKKADMGKIVV